MPDTLLANPEPALLVINGAPVSTSNPLPTTPAGGSGGAVTIADGGDVTLGARADAAVVGDVNGSVSAKLRGLSKLLNDVWDSVNHRLKVDGSAVTQPVSAASLPLPTGAATETTLAGIKTGTDKIPASPATDRATAAAPAAARLSDGAAFYKATTPTDTQPISAVSLPLPTGAATQTTLASVLAALPAALVGGRLDVNIGNTPTVAGGKSNNAAVPGATNLGTLSGVATAADPAYTEGNQVALSTNLLGHLRSCVNGFAAPGNAAVGNPVYMAGIDGGGLIRGVSMDVNGRQVVIGAAAAGSPFLGNPVPIGISDGTNINYFRDATGMNGSAGPGILAVGPLVYDGSVWRRPLSASASVDGALANYAFSAGQIAFNETNHDRFRNNTDIAVLTSALRTTTQTVNFTNYNSLYLRVTIDVTAVATSSLVVTIDVNDSASGKWITLLTSAAITGVSTVTFLVGPGVPVVANLSANATLGRLMRVVVTPGNTNNTTYSVGRQLSGT
jgi:hypothetical protein